MPSRSTTAYAFIADALRREIIDGSMRAGERIPTESELCARFSASRITVRRALQILSDELLIVRRQGSGSYVSGTPSRKIPLLNTDFGGSLAQHAPDLTRKLDRSQWESVSDEVAAHLQTFPGARALFARRIDLVDSEPVAYDEISLLQQFADRLTEEDLAQLDFLPHWQRRQQFEISHLTQSIEAVMSDDNMAQLLGITAGAPVLKEVDVMFLPLGTPCGLFVSFYRHDLFRLTSTVRFAKKSADEPLAKSARHSVLTG
jgi:GntR family transcriptional regulator